MKEPARRAKEVLELQEVNKNVKGKNKGVINAITPLFFLTVFQVH
jgi:hypothetical protein